MTKRMSLSRILLLLLTLCTSSILAKSASVLLREGLYAEEVEGDLKAAIEVYQQVIDDKNAQDSLVAQALYRQGMCHMKLQNDADAKAAFSKLMTDFSDQTQVIEKVRPLLDEIGNADPASLMPPGTIAYVEIGNPGKQIEKILSMFKGTPLENPLNMIGGQKKEWSPGQTRPVDMVGALMNPSMMTEFKKIRGIGIGITGIAKDTPHVIVVLYPGKSDALRGILQAVLGAVSRPVQAIEGMTTVEFPDGGGAAYDDTVVILASPPAYDAGQLQWSVKQYMNPHTQPSLASSNASFAKIGKNARQRNALTLWLNVNETYQNLMKVLPPDAIPQQIHIANGLVDFKNVDDIIASLSIEDAGIALEANLKLKEGHNCVAYNMIRTPHIDKAALKAVPPEAVGIVSLAVGEPGTPQAQAIGQQIINGTGLDIGDDLFTNIQQITLFALPMEDTAEQQSWGVPPQARSVALAISSDNPQQTRNLLTTLLRTAELLTAETEPVDGKYELTVADQQKIFAYMDQANKVTVLSLNPNVIAASVTAMKRTTAADATLPNAARALPQTTSKLVMVDLAGAIQFGLQNAELPDNDMGDQVRQAMAQLVKTAKGATLRLQTDEEANSFGIRLSLNDLPPAGQIFGPLSQIQHAMEQIAAEGNAWGKQAPAVGITATSTPPAIDGRPEPCWNAVEKHHLKNSYYQAPASKEDLSASFQALYDSDNLYILVDVTDDDLQNDSDEFWLDDAVEIFIDADNSKRGSYDDNDFQYHFGWDAASPVLGESQHGNMQGVEAAFATTDTGYRAEIKFPWATLGTRPKVGTPIGLDVQVNDDDGGGDRDSKIAWRAPQDDAYLHPRVLGTVQPLGLVARWKLDEDAGNRADDASGNGRTGKLIGNPTWKPSAGKVGGALEFDGQDDYVDTGYTTDLPTWTVAAWVSSPAAPSDEKQTGPVHREKNYQINWDHMIDDFRGSAALCTGGTWHAASFGSLQADTWYHLAATYDGQTLRAYKNGVLVTENADPSGAPDVESESLKFGRHAMTSDHFRGRVDDIRLYNHALDAAEMAALAGK